MEPFLETMAGRLAEWVLAELAEQAGAMWDERTAEQRERMLRALTRAMVHALAAVAAGAGPERARELEFAGVAMNTARADMTAAGVRVARHFESALGGVARAVILLPL